MAMLLLGDAAAIDTDRGTVVDDCAAGAWMSEVGDVDTSCGTRNEMASLLAREGAPLAS
jgi:hypothetical protein